jgi:DNA polymerase-1
MVDAPPAAPRLFLIDAYALIYRSFFAFINRPLTNSRGENTSAPWGFVNFLITIRVEYQPDYLAIVFDSGLSHREKEFPEYKATRKKMPDELRASIPRIRALVEAFNDEVVELEGYEADDVIGTLVRKAIEAGTEAVVVSGDKDFYQLVGPGVHLLNPGRGGPTGVAAEWVDESNASERLGIKPGQVVDFLALVGDASDNVPGAPGIGAGWARRLLTEVGPLEELLDHPERIPWQSKRESISQNVDLIRLSKKLVTIQTDLSVELDLERLRVHAPNLDRLRRICGELEFHSLLDRFSESDDESHSLRESTDYRVLGDISELRQAVASARDAGRVSVETFTTAVEPVPTTLVGVAFSWSEGAGVYLPLRHENPPGSLLEADADAVHNFPALDDPSMSSLAELLADETVDKVGHDLKLDLLVLRGTGIELAGIQFDTMVASYVLDPGRRQHDLDVLAADFLGKSLSPRTDLTGRGKQRVPAQELEPEAACSYGCRRSDFSLRLCTRFQATLKDQGLEGLFHTLETPLIPILANMEWAGIRIDAVFFGAMSRKLDQELRLVRQDIFREAGREFNVNSNPQLREVLFGELNLPVIRRTKTGPSTDAAALEELAARGHTLPMRLLEYRQLEKLRSTYVDALPKLVNPSTGRIHASFNQTVAATGRLSSSDPNLQNIPIRSEIGRQIRKGFVADEGNRFLATDYSQIELRILAHFSGDPAFVSAFWEGIDIHRQTASVIFEVPVDEVTPEQRAKAKTINFATLYGQGEFSLARQLGIPRGEAAKFIGDYFDRFSGVRAFLDGQVESARKLGYAETLNGRRRYIPELQSKNWNVRQFGERVAQNTPIQGSAADLIKVAMIRIHDESERREFGGTLLLQVHDELVFEVPEPEMDTFREMVVGHMEAAMDLDVPLKVDVGTGVTWYDCKA